MAWITGGADRQWGWTKSEANPLYYARFLHGTFVAWRHSEGITACIFDWKVEGKLCECVGNVSGIKILSYKETW